VNKFLVPRIAKRNGEGNGCASLPHPIERLIISLAILIVMCCVAINKKPALRAGFFLELWWRSVPQDETRARSLLQSRSEGRTYRRRREQGIPEPAA